MFGILGVVIVAVITIGHRMGGRDARLWSWSMACGLAALVAAGMGLDLLHSLASEGTAVARRLTMAEDGGELLASTLLLAVAAAWHHSSSTAVSPPTVRARVV